MSAQEAFVVHLRYDKSLIACTEVSASGGIADVLALDLKKELVYEYEFKRSSQDLKVNEPKKSKYQLVEDRRWLTDAEKKKLNTKKSYVSYYDTNPKPNKFYFVVTKELWEKEEEYLKALPNTGVIIFYLRNEKYVFDTVKRCGLNKSNLHNFNVLKDVMLSRISSSLACELRRQYVKNN